MLFGTKRLVSAGNGKSKMSQETGIQASKKMIIFCMKINTQTDIYKIDLDIYFLELRYKFKLQPITSCLIRTAKHLLSICKSKSRSVIAKIG